MGENRIAKSLTNPALSPDEKRVAIDIRDPQTDDRDIWIYDLERGGKTCLTFGEGDNFNPVWSPDGSRIAYSSKRKANRDLYIRNANGSGEEQALMISGIDKPVESWSPDGRFLSFQLQAPGNWDIYLLPMDAPGKPPLPFRATKYAEHNSSFSPVHGELQIGRMRWLSGVLIHCRMRDVTILFIHLIVTLARLARPGGLRSVVAESGLIGHQLLK